MEYAYLEPKWPLFWLEKTFFWTKNKGQMGSRYIYIYRFISNHFHRRLKHHHLHLQMNQLPSTFPNKNMSRPLRQLPLKPPLKLHWGIHQLFSSFQKLLGIQGKKFQANSPWNINREHIHGIPSHGCWKVAGNQIINRERTWKINRVQMIFLFKWVIF